MDELEKINNKIKKIKQVERVQAWKKANPEKAKKLQDDWNKKNRNDYQRAYYKLNKKTA